MVFLWMLLFIPLLWIPQNCIHEGAHAVTARLSGMGIDKFWPLPSFMGLEWRKENFRFAYVMYEGGQSLSNSKWSICHIMPVYVNIAVCVLCVAVSMMTAPLPDYGAGLLFAFCVNNMLDGVNNLRQGIGLDDRELMTDNNDVVKWIRRTGRSPAAANWYGVCGIIALSLLLTATIVVQYH